MPIRKLTRNYKDAVLLRGDCLERMATLKPGSIDLVLTDPPYGTTRCRWDTPLALPDMWRSVARVARANAPLVFTAAQPFSSALVMSNPKLFGYEWIWQKEAGTGLLNAKRQPLRDHESVLVFYRKPPPYHPQFTQGKPYTVTKGGETECYNNSGTVTTRSDGRRYPKTVQRFNRDRNRVHPTQKPVALMAYLIRTYTKEGATVLDFTMGSGTTGVACRHLGRKFVGIELDAGYFETACDRIKAARRCDA